MRNISESRRWNIMIYMAGDNNLSIDMSYALEDLRAKTAAIAGNSLNLFVYYLNDTPEIPAIYCDFSDIENPVYTYSNEIENPFSSKTIEFEGSDGVVPLIDFVSWCNETSKAASDPASGAKNRNALIFSGHTMGFLSLGLLKDE
ncbi:MAG: hypothetical protein HKN25_06945, partial [Pyrinomonadaceae bacterium]|nr:hypothetical protein [Pyrinomonadaceae bacterium]